MEWEFKLPKEYRDLQEDVNKTLNTIQEIENEINALGTDRGLRPELNPPTIRGAAGKFGSNPNTELIKKHLENLVENLKDELYQRVDLRLEEADPKVAKSIKNDIDRVAYPTGLDLKSDSAERVSIDKKELDQSQNYIREQIYDHQDRHRDNTPESVVEDYTDRFLDKFSDPSRFEENTEPEVQESDNVVDDHTENFLNQLKPYRQAKKFQENRNDIVVGNDESIEP